MVNTNPIDVECIEKAKKRLLQAYLEVCNWMMVGRRFGVNHVYIYKFVNENNVPNNKDVRQKMKLPRTLPSEKRHYQKNRPPKIGRDEGWFDYYSKKIGKNVTRLKIKCDDKIQSILTDEAMNEK